MVNALDFLLFLHKSLNNDRHDPLLKYLNYHIFHIISDEKLKNVTPETSLNQRIIEALRNLTSIFYETRSYKNIPSSLTL